MFTACHSQSTQFCHPGTTRGENDWAITASLLPSAVATFAANYVLNVHDRLNQNMGFDFPNLLNVRSRGLPTLLRDIKRCSENANILMGILIGSFSSALPGSRARPACNPTTAQLRPGRSHPSVSLSRLRSV